jgi:hypothetical protein
MKISFTANDIRDTMHLSQIIEEHTASIFNGCSRHGRSKEQIKNSVTQGMIAEQWCIEKFGWKKSKNKYHDLEDKSGKVIEIKTSRSKEYLEQQVKVVKEATWNNSDYFLGFLFDPISQRYNLAIKEDLRCQSN